VRDRRTGQQDTNRSGAAIFEFAVPLTFRLVQLRVQQHRQCRGSIGYGWYTKTGTGGIPSLFGWRRRSSSAMNAIK